MSVACGSVPVASCNDRLAPMATIRRDAEMAPSYEAIHMIQRPSVRKCARWEWHSRSTLRCKRVHDSAVVRSAHCTAQVAADGCFRCAEHWELGLYLVRDEAVPRHQQR